MANQQPTIRDHLQAIIDAKAYATYEGPALAGLELVKGYAKYILSLDLGWLGQASPQRWNGPTPRQQQWTYADRASYAQDTTLDLRNQIDGLCRIPSNAQERDINSQRFSVATSEFIDAWNFFIPAMQATVGRNPLEQFSNIKSQLEKSRAEAEEIVRAMRAASAKAGIAPQAVRFADAADSHDHAAKSWLIATICVTGAFFLMTVAAMILYRWSAIAPRTAIESVQFLVGKIIVFSVLSYTVFLCARNYIAQKHNAVVNRHRQNALLTYEALVKAAGDPANSDVVLKEAAACIFAPQPTGFAREAASEAPTAKSVVELLGPLSRGN